jgi:ATP-dependent DNA helicase DinG
MAVAATHAALRLAQGAGRLVRTATDRGVVAVLDPRLATARYGAFLRSSLPPFWPTTDRAVALAALRRIDAAAGPVAPVRDPVPRVKATEESPTASSTSEKAPAIPPGPAPTSTRTAVVQGRAWSAAEDDQLREGVQFGCTVEDLADQFDCEPATIAMRLAMLSLAAPSEADPG